MTLPDAACVGGRLTVADQEHLLVARMVGVRVSCVCIHARRLYTEAVPGKPCATVLCDARILKGPGSEEMGDCAHVLEAPPA